MNTATSATSGRRPRWVSGIVSAHGLDWAAFKCTCNQFILCVHPLRGCVQAKDDVVKVVKTGKVIRGTLKEKLEREAAEQRAQQDRDRLEAARKKQSRLKPKKSLRPVPKAQVSQVTQYADMTASHDADKLKWYLHIWTVKLKHAEDEEVNLDRFKDALRMANRKLITDEEIQFCMSALDIVHDASHHEVPYNYKMFVTLASLADRIKSLEHIMVGHVSKIDYSNAKGLEHKILEARKLFYLADGAKTNGMMAFDELEDICAAGGIDGDVVDDIMNEQLNNGSNGIDFLDFLVSPLTGQRLHSCGVPNPG